MGMADTLVLDLSNRPIGFVSWQRAVKMYWEDRAEIVKEDPHVFLHSPSIEMNMPRVIKAKNYVVKRLKLSVPFSRRNIALRDNSECQYCGKFLHSHEYTLDHVIPRSKGGLSTWLNLVLACIKCNKIKNNHTLAESGMTLLKKPMEPKATDPRYNFKLHIKKLRPEWKEWADGGWLYWNVELDK
jgi:5-methylcytosine-specific restriction endonuclease McrA